MRPAAAKAPFDYLMAVVICLITIGCSFAVKPAITEWIVFGVGVAMLVVVLGVALRPVRD